MPISNSPPELTLADGKDAERVAWQDLNIKSNNSTCFGWSEVLEMEDREERKQQRVSILQVWLNDARRFFIPSLLGACTPDDTLPCNWTLSIHLLFMCMLVPMF